METIQEKCLRFINDPKIKIRRNSGIFSVNELATIEKTTNWIRIDDFKERIFCIAYNITNDRRCPITKRLIRDITTLRYHRIGKVRMLNDIFPQKDFSIDKNKLFFDYNFNIIEEEFRRTSPNVASRYPIYLNHCYVQLLKRGFCLSEIESDAEAFHLYRENFESFPICEITKSKKKFNIKGMHYYNYSSRSAANQAASIKHSGKSLSTQTIEKRKQTCLQKYGVTSPFKLETNRELCIKTKKEKAIIRKKEKESIRKLDTRTSYEKYKETCIQKYGVENPSKNQKFFKDKNGDWTKQAIENREKTTLLRYGVKNANQSKKIKDKIKQTILKKYGVSCYMNHPEVLSKTLIKKKTSTYNNFKRFSHISTPEFTLEYWITHYKERLPWRRTSNNQVFYAYYTGYTPIGNFKNTIIEERIHEILNTLNITYEKNRRDLIQPHEIDIYIPKYKIGIECNGEYFHSSRTKSKDYHLTKKQLCEQQGIELLHFYGNEIITKHKIIKGIIRSKMLGNKYRIHARKCYINTISSDTARKFCDKYHLNGFSAASIHLGMFYKHRLVSYVSLGSNRFTNKTDNVKEIIRYVTLNNFYIMGGLEKFISHITKKLKITNILTYADNNLFNGNCYKRAGFTYIGLTPPGYFYYGGSYKIYSRYQCQKHKLKNILGDKVNPTLTEEENMNNEGFYRVYDCGNHKYSLIIN